MKSYITEAKVDDNVLECKNCVRRFRLEKTLYVNTLEVTFPAVVEVENNNFMKRARTVNIIDYGKVSYLCDQKMLTDWRTALFFAEKKL